MASFVTLDNSQHELFVQDAVVLQHEQGCVDFAGKTIDRKAKAKSWHNRSKFKQNMLNQLATIVMFKMKYSNIARMIKGRVPPKFLVHVATQTEKLIYSDRTINTFDLKNGIY